MLRFKGSDLHPVLEEARRLNCHVAFVKDQGVYLLSENGESLASGTRKHLAYAIGCNPHLDPFDTWWNNARAELGGGDFVEYLNPRDPVFSKSWETGGDVLIEATDTELSITVQVMDKPKR